MSFDKRLSVTIVENTATLINDARKTEQLYKDERNLILHLYKTQLHVGQGLISKAWYPEIDRKDSKK